MPEAPRPAPADPPGLLQRLWRRGLLYGVKVGNVGISMVVSLLLARVGGPETLGSFAIAIQTAQLLSYALVVGKDQLLLRDVAASVRLGDRGKARARIRWAVRTVLPAAVAGALVFALAVTGLDRAGLAIAADPALLLGAGFVLANCLYLLGLATVRGLGMTMHGQVYEGIYQLPLALVLLWTLARGGDMAPSTAVGLATMFLLASMALLAWQARAHIRGWPVAADMASADRREGTALMLAQLSMFAGQWLPLFMAGQLGSAADAGGFRAAWQLAFPLLVILTTTANVRSALYSGDLSVRRADLVRRRLSRDRLVGVGLGLGLGLPILIWPGPLMALLFGQGFGGYEDVVRLLVLTHLATLTYGPVGSIVAMSGRSRELLPASLLALVAQLVIGLLGWQALGPMALVWGIAAAQGIRFIWGLTTLRRLLADCERGQA
jgi:O-antigen/teichoic acid export membrane protein